MALELEQRIFKERKTVVAKKQFKKCSSTTREMHIKITLRCHLTPVIMAKKSTKQTTTNTGGNEGRKEILVHLVRLQTGLPTMEIMWRIVKMLKINLHMTQLYQSLEYTQRTQHPTPQTHVQPCSLPFIHNRQKMETIKCSTMGE